MSHEFLSFPPPLCLHCQLKHLANIEKWYPSKKGVSGFPHCSGPQSSQTFLLLWDKFWVEQKVWSLKAVSRSAHTEHIDLMLMLHFLELALTLDSWASPKLHENGAQGQDAFTHSLHHPFRCSWQYASCKIKLLRTLRLGQQSIKSRAGPFWVSERVWPDHLPQKPTLPLLLGNRLHAPSAEDLVWMVSLWGQLGRNCKTTNRRRRKAGHQDQCAAWEPKFQLRERTKYS